MAIRDRLLLPLAALLAILPLAVHGCSCGHDFDFHLLSWQEAARQFAHGNLHPRWAFTPAWGAGEPRFVFYPPVSWTLGALLTLAAAHLQPLLQHLPGLHRLTPEQAFAVTPIAYTWIALTLAGLAMYHLARRFVAPAPALLAATLYLANPYTLFTAFERAAFAELLAAAWLPLLLAAILPAPAPATPRANSPTTTAPLSIPSTAIPLALLWLTNAPAAVMGSYALAFIVLLRLLALARDPETRPQALPFTAKAIAATALGLALAAFYIVPAVLERSWVSLRMAVLPGLRPDDNTLFHRTADAAHDAVLHTASLLALTLLALTALALVTALLRTRFRPAWLQTRDPFASAADLDLPGYLRLESAAAPILPLLLPRASAPVLFAVLGACTAVIAFLLTPLSLPLWHHLPELAFLQFPWRLLALLAPLGALALALALPRRLPRQTPAVPLLLVAALAFPTHRNFHQICDAEDTPQARFDLFRTPTGDEPTDEYTPATADNDSLHDNNPGYRLLPADANDDTPPPPDANPSAAPLTLDLRLPAPAMLVFNLRDYPSWQIERNGAPDPDRLRRADGLLAIPLPAGPQHLRLTEHTPPPEFAADALSITALCLLLAVPFTRRRFPHRLAPPQSSQSARDMIKPS